MLTDLRYLKNKSGVYQIRNLINDKVYVGSSNNLYIRRSVHFNYLVQKKHINSYLQNAYNKYGEINFLFEVIEYCDEKSLLLVEQKWMNNKRSYERDKGYNISKVAGRNPWPKGKPRSEQTKEKLRKAFRGRVFSEEWKRKISENRKNIKPSKETIEKFKKIPKKKGEESNRAKFTWKQAREIRECYYNSEVTYKQLAEKYRVSVSGIQNVIKNRSFVEKEYIPINNHKDKNGSKNPSAKLTEQKVLDIREKYSQGDTINDLATIYCVSYACVRNIVLHKSWKNLTRGD